MSSKATERKEYGTYRKIIANTSLGFAKNARSTFLIFMGILIFGLLSYKVFLQRDGFPSVQFPVGIVSVRNFVEDPSQNDSQITRPIELALAALPEVEKINSTTTADGAYFFVTFDSKLSSEEGVKIAKSEIQETVTFPENAVINYRSINASSVDGFHDMLFTISSSKGASIKEQEEKAAEVVKEIEKLPEVLSAEVVEQVTEETNANGEKFDFKSSFQRVAYKDENGKIIFEPAVSIGVNRKKSGVGVIDLSNAIQHSINDLKDQGKLDGYTVSYGGDLAGSVKDQISALEQNAIEGILGVIIVAFLFISWRTSIVTALFIPTVMSLTFITLFLTGNTLNVITLFALILVLGLLVDDGTVVIEAIERKLREGKTRKEAIRQAISEVGPADISGTIAIVLAFMPMLFISGILGEFIRLIPITVILTLLYSLLIALTIIPFLSGVILKRNEGKKYTGISKVIDTIAYGPGRLVEKLGDQVYKLIHYYLGKKILTFAIAILGLILIVVGVSFTSKLEFNIFPEAKDSEQLNVAINYYPGTDIDTAEAIAKRVEVIATKAIGEENMESAIYFEGSDSSALLTFELTPINERDLTAKQMVEKMNDELGNFKDAQVKPASSSVGPPAEDYQFFMQVYSDSQLTLDKSTAEFENYLKTKDFGDTDVTEVLVTDLDTVSKNDGRRFAQVKAKLSNTTDTRAVLDIENQIKDEYNAKKLESLGLADDAIEFDKGQESENLRSFYGAIFAFGATMILLYVLLVIQFNSFSQPLLVMFAIPLTFPGLFPGLYLTNNPLSFFVMIGVIGLAGIVVNNTIVLMDFANQSRNEGKSIRESISSAVRSRFRAIATTSTTTIIGLLPLALAEPFWESLAFSIIFGLISSVLLVILVFPAYYAIIEKLREIRGRIFKRINFATID